MSSAETQALLADRMNGIFTPLEISSEQFRKAYDTSEIGPHIEKDYKGLSYLSWPFAYRYLKEHFPALYVAFEEKTMGSGVWRSGAYYLRPYLTDGIKRTVALVFPIMDRKHNAIKELDGRAIGDNCQRAAVKAIATFTGLGLRLYAGEDIPKENPMATHNGRKPLLQRLRQRHKNLPKPKLSALNTMASKRSWTSVPRTLCNMQMPKLAKWQ